MNTPIIIFLCCTVGHIAGYNVQRDLPYSTGPNDPYAIEVVPSISLEPSQRLFWGDQGSNQVGGNGWWATLTNKFPFLNKFSSRMELPATYGIPEVSQVYGPPGSYQHQYNQAQYPQFVPSLRDVGFTDDAVIITPPQVPIVPQPAPEPSPQPSPGYHYSKPLYRLDLPHK